MVPAGTQFNRMYEAYMAHERGGKVVGGRDKELFKIASKDEWKSYFAGPWATEQGIKYNKERFHAWQEKVPGPVRPVAPLVPLMDKAIETLEDKKKEQKKKSKSGRKRRRSRR